ncbi:MAG: BatA domain-containing protein [Akkermansiaceae bacterium]
MNFLAPQFLWGFLALIPLVAAYLLKVRPRKKQTNTWFLWEQIFEEKNNTSLFSKLRNFLSLLLMLIALALIILGLSQPSFHKEDTSSLIIVIDRSASMNTKVGTSDNIRLDEAKTKAHDLIKSLGAGQRASLAVLDSDLLFLTHLSNNTHRLHQAIDSITPSITPLSQNAISTIIETTQSTNSEENSNNHRILLITDGCANFPETTTGIEVLNIADDETPNNIGIIAADIQPNPRDTSARCMVKLASSLTKPIKVEIELFHPATGSVGKLSEFTLTPGINAPFFLDIPEAAPGEWIARILREDSLPQDNSAQLILRKLPTIPVKIPTEDNYFYQRCIDAFTRAGGSLQIADSETEDTTSVTVFHGSVPADITGNVIIFSPSGTSPFWTNLGEEFIVNLAIAENPQHPILRHTDINQLTFPGAKKITTTDTARIILESDDKTPLIYQINELNRSIIVINLNPAQGDFFLSPSFPVMIYDAATYLSGNSARLASTYATGSQLSLNPEEIDGEITTPSSKQNSNDHLNLNLNQLGIYSWQNKGKPIQVSTSLLSANDSLLESKISSSTLTNLATGYPLSFWLIVLGIIFLTVESILYHRRKAD